MYFYFNYARDFLLDIGWIKPPVFISEVVSQHPTPDSLEEGKLVIVKNGRLKKWACFRCPGGCGLKIMLSLSPNRSPRWRVKSDWLGRPSIKPSIRQLNDCGCHFWIRRGGVEWCLDSKRRMHKSTSIDRNRK